MKLAAYVRATAAEVSTGLWSCAEQLRRLRAHFEKEGGELVEVFRDDDIGLLPTAPQLGPLCSMGAIIALLDRAREAPWSRVVVTSLDRLRHPGRDQDAAAELLDEGKPVLELGASLGVDLVALARDRRRERARKAQSVPERLLRGRIAGARAGKFQSGPSPYGYTRDYTERSKHGVRLQIHPEEAEVVRMIFKEYLRRGSMAQLIRLLEARGLKTRGGKNWSKAGVRWILKNETYLGRVHFGKVRAKGEHPALVSPIVFNKVQRLIKKNHKRGKKS